MSAGTSSGGILLKLPGRVGQVNSTWPMLIYRVI